MHVVFSDVVPNSIATELHGVGVRGQLEVTVRVPVGITSAAHLPTDEAYPEVLVQFGKEIENRPAIRAFFEIVAKNWHLEYKHSVIHPSPPN